MVQTLPEYARSVDDPLARTVIELFPMAVDFMGVMPFKTAPGGAYRYQQEGALPTNIGFRAINEEPTEGHGVLNDLVESCFPIAGNADTDRILELRHGSERRARDQIMSVKKKAKVFADTFIAGDNQTAPREFSGLQTRLQIVGGDVSASNYESRVVANNTTSGGGPLSLSMLDLAINHVEQPNAIIMPRKLRARLGRANRDTSIAGFVTNDIEDGQRVTRYDGIPIYTGYGITKFGEFLPFNEVAHGGGSAVTASIYVVSFRDGGLCGLETAPMEVTDIGLTEGGVWKRVNIEHDVGMCLEDPYAAVRLTSITDAPIVA